MIRLVGFILLVIAAMGCQQSEVVSEFTGNETTYSLQQGSVYNISGTVVFKERKDGQITAVVQLSGTEGDLKHPVHLHLGDISKPAADISVLLNPVLGKTGRSETVFRTLTDESAIDYKSLLALPACIKIHLSNSGPDRDIIIAAGNIGTSFDNSPSGSRLGISVCKSE